MLTEATGHVEIDVPRDRDGSFDPLPAANWLSRGGSGAGCYFDHQRRKPTTDRPPRIFGPNDGEATSPLADRHTQLYPIWRKSPWEAEA